MTVMRTKQTAVTDYFSVRRSSRKPKETLVRERMRDIANAVKSRREDGLGIRFFDNKGRGVVAAKNFSKGDFFVEYSGDLIDLKEAERREFIYSLDRGTGCYMYYFVHQNRQFCVDATQETGRLGRLINHSRQKANVSTKTLVLDGVPHLILFASRDIEKGEEILYDYGDRSKESLANHPWLAF